MFEPSSRPEPQHPAPMQGLPTLLDCLRIELEAVRKRGRSPIKLVVHGDCLPALYETAESEGELDKAASPSRILDLPVTMSCELLSVAEGARIVCEGDDLHAKLLKRRSALFAGLPA